MYREFNHLYIHIISFPRDIQAYVFILFHTIPELNSLQWELNMHRGEADLGSTTATDSNSTAPEVVQTITIS